MVLESLINPLRAERRPWEMFFLGLLYASVALFLSTQLFEGLAGLIAVFLTVIVSVPIVYNTIKLEEKKDTLGLDEKTLLKEHGWALSIFIFLFIGVMFAFILWYLFLPGNMVSSVFSVQIDTIQGINSVPVSGNLDGMAVFMKIFFNNVKVMVFCLLFAFFFGAGAIFILTWNASVIAVAIGAYTRKHLETLSYKAGFTALGSYLHALSLGLARYVIHGIPEIIAYFIAGLAGGIISVAVVRHDFNSNNFRKIVLDSVDLILIAFVVLVIAALIEVFITPTLF